MTSAPGRQRELRVAAERSGVTRTLALGGIAGPLLFTAVTIICAMLQPGYDHFRNLISELGAHGTANATFMNYAGFIPAGIMMIAFGVALSRILPSGQLATTAAALIMIFGLGVVTSGIFSCDPGCPVDGSLENTIHDRVAPFTFLSLIIAIAIFGFVFRRTPDWSQLARYSLFSSAVAFVCMIALIISFGTRTQTGLWQRLMLAALFLWCARIGLNAYRVTRIHR